MSTERLQIRFNFLPSAWKAKVYLVSSFFSSSSFLGHFTLGGLGKTLNKVYLFFSWDLLLLCLYILNFTHIQYFHFPTFKFTFFKESKFSRKFKFLNRSNFQKILILKKIQILFTWVRKAFGKPQFYLFLFGIDQDFFFQILQCSLLYLEDGEVGTPLRLSNQLKISTSRATLSHFASRAFVS